MTKLNSGAELAKEKAKTLVAQFPECTNVQDLIDTANANNLFSNNDELLAVWGRVCRLLPQKVVA